MVFIVLILPYFIFKVMKYNPSFKSFSSIEEVGFSIVLINFPEVSIIEIDCTPDMSEMVS